MTNNAQVTDVKLGSENTITTILGSVYQSVTMVAHFVCILLTSFVAYVSKPGSSLFSWHPTLLTMAFSFFMMEGILFFSPHSSLLQKYSRQAKRRAHWVTMLFAVVCMIVGLLAILITKKNTQQYHFTSWHGLFGIITIIYTLIQCFGGSFQIITVLQKCLPKSMTLSKLKGYHATSGLILYLLANITLFLGMQSTWFTQTVTGTSWYACTACPMILLFIASSQVTAAYLPKAKQ